MEIVLSFLPPLLQLVAAFNITLSHKNKVPLGVRVYVLLSAFVGLASSILGNDLGEGIGTKQQLLTQILGISAVPIVILGVYYLVTKKVILGKYFFFEKLMNAWFFLCIPTSLFLGILFSNNRLFFMGDAYQLLYFVTAYAVSTYHFTSLQKVHQFTTYLTNIELSKFFIYAIFNLIAYFQSGYFSGVRSDWLLVFICMELFFSRMGLIKASKMRQYLLFGALLLLPVFLRGAGTRSALFTTISIPLLLVIFFARVSKNRTGSFVRLNIGLLRVLLVASFAFLTLVYTGVISTESLSEVNQTVGFVSQDTSEPSLQLRIDETISIYRKWTEGSYIEKMFGFGSGATYNFVSVSTSQGFYSALDGSLRHHAHFTPNRVLLMTGIVGLVVFFTMLLSIFFELGIRLNVYSQYKLLIVPFFTLSVVYLIQTPFVDVFFKAILWGLYLGICSNLLIIASKKNRTSSNDVRYREVNESIG